MENLNLKLQMAPSLNLLKLIEFITSKVKFSDEDQNPKASLHVAGRAALTKRSFALMDDLAPESPPAAGFSSIFQSKGGFPPAHAIGSLLLVFVFWIVSLESFFSYL